MTTKYELAKGVAGWSISVLLDASSSLREVFRDPGRPRASRHSPASGLLLALTHLSPLLNPFSPPRTDGAFAKITQLFGHATSGVDTEVVANSGVHGPVTPILIEGQPLLEGLNQERELQYGNSHSITLLVDSLALQELFQTVDPTLTQAQMETIFKAASDAKAGLVGQTHVAEGDTLELALDALRKVFVGPQAPPTDFNENAGGFGDLSFRDQFYTHLQEVKTALNGQPYQVLSLVEMPTETLKGNALLPGETGTAYRYAVKELNPFVVMGADYTQFSNPGDLDLYDPTTGNGSITLEYLKDRATFLEKKSRSTRAPSPRPRALRSAPAPSPIIGITRVNTRLGPVSCPCHK